MVALSGVAGTRTAGPAGGRLCRPRSVCPSARQLLPSSHPRRPARDKALALQRFFHFVHASGANPRTKPRSPSLKRIGLRLCYFLSRSWLLAAPCSGTRTQAAPHDGTGDPGSRARTGAPAPCSARRSQRASPASQQPLGEAHQEEKQSKGRVSGNGGGPGTPREHLPAPSTGSPPRAPTSSWRRLLTLSPPQPPLKRDERGEPERSLGNLSSPALTRRPCLAPPFSPSDTWGTRCRQPAAQQLLGFRRAQAAPLRPSALPAPQGAEWQEAGLSHIVLLCASAPLACFRALLRLAGLRNSPAKPCQGRGLGHRTGLNPCRCPRWEASASRVVGLGRSGSETAEGIRGRAETSPVLLPHSPATHSVAPTYPKPLPSPTLPERPQAPPQSTLCPVPSSLSATYSPQLQVCWSSGGRGEMMPAGHIRGLLMAWSRSSKDKTSRELGGGLPGAG